jgi:hypothetical protein
MRKVLVLATTLLLFGLAASLADAGQPLVSPLLCAPPGDFTLYAVKGHVTINTQGDLHVAAKGLTTDSAFTCNVLCFSGPAFSLVSVGAILGAANGQGHLVANVPGFLAPILKDSSCGEIQFDISSGDGWLCRLGVGSGILEP